MHQPQGLTVPLPLAHAALLALLALGLVGAASPLPPAAPPPQQGRVIVYGGNYLGGYVPQMDNVPNETRSGVWGVAAGQIHSMAIWGKSRKVIEWPPANSSYDGYTLPDLSSQRLQPKSLRNVVAVAAGEDHSLALTKAGKVVFWTRKLLGNGTDTLPPILGPKSKTKVKAIAAGRGGFSMALLNNGSIIEWGPVRDYSDNSTWYRAPPPGLLLPIGVDSSGGPLPRVLRAKAIAAGWDHNLVLLDNGTVVAWGGRRGMFQAYLSLRAVNVSLDARQNAVAIAAGNQHSLALLANGTVVAWGAVLANVVGASCAAESCKHPAPPPAGPNNVPDVAVRDVVGIAAGSQFAMALIKGGKVVVWGRSSGYLYVQHVPDDAMTGVFAMSGGSAHWLAVKATGGAR